MGGDQLVPALAGEELAEERGDAIREAEAELYAELIEEVQVMDGAPELIADLCEAGNPVVLASSAKQQEVDHYLDLLGTREVVDAWTTSADVDATKPDPDLVVAARGKVDAPEAVMVGDTPWDAKAAAAAGVETIAVLTGGFSAGELREAGAIAVFESVRELHQRLAQTPLSG
jgi:HAD superfamily hydrolase (TIGR01549 family)